jgi:pimeloyl-ACP methyl ester carboxylesterase
VTAGEPHVFISYYRSDVAIAEAVRDCLSTNQISTWMDQYDIPAGAYWPDEIDKGLGKSDFVVGLLSPEAVESRNVKNEWDWALQNGKQLILVMARSCVIPHRYVSINFIDALNNNLQPALDALVRTPGMRPALPKPVTPRTRYALSNGLSVAWQEFGSGEIDLVYVPGFVSHVEHSWTHPALKEHLLRFGSLARVLKFDKRGTGMSDWASGIPSQEERMDDIRAVMDAAGSERAVLYGLSQGVPLSIMFAAVYPERTRGLILYGGSATYVKRPDYPWQKTLVEWQSLIAEEEVEFPKRWGTIDLARESLHRYAPSAVDDDDVVEWMAGFMRLGATPGAAIALDRMDLEVDVRDILPAIRVPTLVIHRVGELDADIGEGRYVAERIPGAVLKELPGVDHLPFVGEQEPFFAAIEEFLANLTDGAETSSVPHTVLATVVVIEADNIDATQHSGPIARAAERFRGRLITLDTHQITAAFDGAGRAIRFAHAVAGLLSRAGANVAGGLQSGEVELGETYVRRAPADLARALAQEAEPGQLLATSTVRDLVAGSGIRFAEANQQQKRAFRDGPTVLVVERDSVTETSANRSDPKATS